MFEVKLGSMEKELESLKVVNAMGLLNPKGIEILEAMDFIHRKWLDYKVVDKPSFFKARISNDKRYRCSVSTIWEVYAEYVTYEKEEK